MLHHVYTQLRPWESVFELERSRDYFAKLVGSRVPTITLSNGGRTLPKVAVGVCTQPYFKRTEFALLRVLLAM